MASKAASQQWSVETDTSTPATSTLDLCTVLEDVHDGHSKWYGIGLQLGLKPSVLDGMQGSDTTEMLREMLKRWLKNVDPIPTWVALIKALRSKTVDEPTLAEQLEEKHQIVSPTPSSTSSVDFSGHDNSDITDHGKQLEDNLHSATKEIETLKADPSKEQVAESSEFTLERQRSLQSVSDRLTAMQTQLTKLMNHVSSLELDKEAQKESKVPVEDMIKELEYLKDENRHLRTHVTKLEEKVTLLTKEKEDQERSFVEEKMKKEKEIVQKAIELADKSGDYINLLNKMEQMKNERDEAQKQAEELRQQPKTQRTQMSPLQLRIITTEEDRPTPISYLRGVDKVIAEIDFVLTAEAQSCEWRDGGFKLCTPKGALPAGSAPCRINVKASLAGKFEFPENSELVSPIYWVSTPKNLRFSAPLIVHIQHCASVEYRDDSDLSFVVAKCTQPDLPYKFKFLDGGLFVPYNSYGSISVTHFSGLGVVSKQRKCLSYCARTYVASRGQNDWRVYFVIIKDLDIVLKVVDTHYNCFAKRDVGLRIIFKRKEISLDIPTEGQLTSEGWRILPRSYPSVSHKIILLSRTGLRYLHFDGLF